LIEKSSELENYSRILEQKVEERTLELNAANIRLLELDKIKTDFLSTVTHELRTPLALVLGFTSIINKRFAEVIFPHVKTEDDKVKGSLVKVQKDLDTIALEGNRLTHLIDNLLDITKIEAGRVEWDMESISVAEVIEEAKDVTGSFFDQNKLELIMDVEVEQPLIVGDKDRLKQVVINLISNAIKFTEAGSITCRTRKQGNEIVISVIDTGVGIAGVDQEKIFEKFRQAGNRLTGKPKGTGLGLSICKQIVDYHGGRIWVESKPGEGSNFSFALPIPIS
jgi:signal transduction histidine kinase